jgi:hypothetical protein
MYLLMALICSLVYFVVKDKEFGERLSRPANAVTGRGGSDGTRTRGLRRDRPAF